MDTKHRHKNTIILLTNCVMYTLYNCANIKLLFIISCKWSYIIGVFFICTHYVYYNDNDDYYMKFIVMIYYDSCFNDDMIDNGCLFDDLKM